MTWVPAGRDSHDIDALVTDRYLETLLAAHARSADGAPTTSEADPTLRLLMVRLTRDLPRFHPSFRFEEALADRLAEAAARMHPTPVASRPLGPTPDPATPTGQTLTVLPDGSVRFAASTDLRPPIGRPLLIGGALTSAALSLAGAYLAWRLKRPSASPMARAARAVARTRLT